MAGELIKGDKKGTKTIVLQALRIYGPISRIDLAKETGLSRATISDCVGELITEGFVCETEKIASTGGRPAILLELASGSHTIIGADFDNDVWTLGAFDLLGHAIDTTRIHVGGASPEAAVRALVQAIPSFSAHLPAEPVKLLGLSVPGLVDPQRGAIHSAADLNWLQVEVGDMVTQELGWPTAVINRQRARGVAECRFGSGKQYAQLIYVGIGTGIAAGLFIDRKLQTGAFGGAGELGHITVEPNGPLCPCGNRGCLQMLSSLHAIELEAKRIIVQYGEMPPWCRDATDGHLQQLKAEAVCRAADAGDPLAYGVVANAASYLGIGLAALVNIMNPEAIILGGRAVKICSTYAKVATDILRQRAMRELSKHTAVKIASYQDLGGALGAANYALDKYMTYSLVRS